MDLHGKALDYVGRKRNVKGCADVDSIYHAFVHSFIFISAKFRQGGDMTATSFLGKECLNFFKLTSEFGLDRLPVFLRHGVVAFTSLINSLASTCILDCRRPAVIIPVPNSRRFRFIAMASFGLKV